jgi:hypothetical protein
MEYYSLCCQADVVFVAVVKGGRVRVLRAEARCRVYSSLIVDEFCSTRASVAPVYWRPLFRTMPVAFLLGSSSLASLLQLLLLPFEQER